MNLMDRGRPLRVLFFVTDLEIGGTPRVVRDLAIRLRSPEITTAVACLAPWGPVAGEIESAGIRTFPFGTTRSWRLPWAIEKLVRLARGYDVVYSLLVHANTVAALASRWMTDVRLIQSIQTTQPDPSWHWLVQGVVQRAAERIVVPSASVAEVAKRWSHIPAERIAIIPNAIDVDSFAQLAPPAFGRRLQVGFVGRLDPIKRVPDLLHAAATLPDVQLQIFGDGEDRVRIERTIDALKLRDRVTMHGQTLSAQTALQQIDILVLPSAAEGFGLVLIEAMAAGRAVIATDVPGIRDVVEHEQTGLLVPAGSPASIAAALARLHNDPALRERLRVNAAAAVRSRYEWPGVLQAYRHLLLGA